MSEFVDDAHQGVNNGPSSTGGGRSESPSHLPHAAADLESRADGGTPPAGSEAPLPLTPDQPWHLAGETVTQAERLRCGTGGGREDEPEHSDQPGVPRRRNVLISLPIDMHERLELLVKSSGLPRPFFMYYALINGARRVVQDVNESLGRSGQTVTARDHTEGRGIDDVG